MDIDRWRISVIGHRTLLWASPVSEPAMEQALDALGDVAGASVLDVGCGTGAVTERLARRGALVTAYDASPFAVEAARARTAGMEGVVVVQSETPPSGAYDVVVSIGSSSAFADTVVGALPYLLAGLRTPGRLLFGDGYWRRRPSEEWLAATGFGLHELTDLQGLRDAVTAAGLQEVYLADVPVDDFDAYEAAWAGSLEAWATEHPDDPLASQARARATVTQARRRIGRDVLGFAVIVAVR